MTLTPVAVERFGGLDLSSDTSEVGLGGAIDLLNVAFDKRGRVYSRPGTVVFNTSTPPASAYYNVVETTAGGTTHLVGFRFDLASTSVVVDTIAADGTLTAAVDTFTGGIDPAPFHTVNFGTPSASYLFVADHFSLAGSGSLMQRWNGTALVDSVGYPKFLALSATDNRLVQARFAQASYGPTGANGTPSTVYFSDPGAPETFTASNFVHLRPGDGEEIRAMVAWRELLFVFKETACFVFYNTSVDRAGEAVFNYRRVDLPSRVLAATGVSGRYVAAAGPDGVYFHCADGIYRTSGEAPQLMSVQVQPIFDGSAPASLARVDDVFSPSNLSWVGERMFLVYITEAATARILVWDRISSTWTLWSHSSSNAIFPAHLRSSIGDTELFSIAGALDVVYFDPDVSTDDGVAIASHYQSGFQTVANGDSARLRRFALTGSGTVSHATASDFAGAGVTASVTMGAAPVLDKSYDTRAARARDLSFRISGTGAWLVARWQSRIADVRRRG